MSYLDKIKKMREDAKSKETKYFTNKRAGNLRVSDLKEGKTIIRVAPGKTIPYMPFRSTYLKVELPIDEMSRWNLNDIIKDKDLYDKLGKTKDELSEVDDDKLKSSLKGILGDGYTQKFNKRLFVATVHGKEGQQRDLIEEYIKFVVKSVDEEVGDRDESRKRLAPIFGAMVNNKWNPGINPSTNFVFYGWNWDEKTFHKIEIYGSQMDRIEELYLQFDSEDEPLATDPFSDPETGVGIEINKVKNEKGKWEYKIEVVPFNQATAKKFGTYEKFTESFKLSEEQLKQLKDVKSIEEVAGPGLFRKKDFELQLNGLFLFDEEHGYNAFQNDEFMDIVEQIGAQYEGEVEEEEKAEEVKSGKDIEETFKNPPAKAKKLKAEEPKVEEEKKEEPIEEDSFKEESKPEEPASNLQDRLAAMRKNLKK
jgi:hypothetical protein